MNIKIYADEMILINTIANYIILTATDIVNRTANSFIKKIVIAVVISVLFTVGIVVKFNFFLNYSFIFIVIMAIIYSLPCKVHIILKNYIIINLLSCLCFGILNKFNIFNAIVLIAALFIVCIILKILINYISYRKYYDISIYNNSKEISVKALLDSGNLLIDPVTGKPVIIAEKDSLQNIYDNRQLRIVPYKSLGNDNGELYVFDAERVKINNRCIQKPVVAIYGTRLSDDRKYKAIISLKHLGGN